MVDFALSEDTRMIVRALGDFVEREVEPREQELADVLRDDRLMLDEDGFLVEAVQRAIGEIRRASAEAGYYAMHMPETVGGGGISKVGMFHAWKEVMGHGLGLNTHVLASVEGPTPLFLAMTPEQQERFLAPMMRGEATSAFCLTEPGAGSDVGAIATTAKRDGDAYVLDGTKTFITNGPYADHYQVFAKTDPSAGLEGISLFMVERDNPGLEIGRAQNSIVNDGAQCEVILDHAEVPAENLVGEEGGGWYLAIGNIGDTRVNIAGMCVGLADFCLRTAADYMQQREAFGKPIGKQGQLQYMFANAATQAEAAENLVLKTSWMMDQGENVMRESSMVKLYCTEMLQDVADMAIQVHGGVGLMRELPLERIFRFARMLRIPEGTNEVQRWTIAKTYGL